MTANVLHQDGGRRLWLGHARHMGRQKHPWMRPERVIRWQRLGFGNVKNRPGKLTRIQRLEQISIDQVRTTANVDQRCPGGQCREQLAVQDTLGGRSERQQADQDVATRQKRLQLVGAGETLDAVDEARRAIPTA
ncbi:hypothetical protein FQZ97_1044580 [compost metagenome]